MLDSNYGLAGDRRPADIPFGPQSVAELVSDFSTCDDLALVGLRESYTYRELSAAVDAAAAAMVELGLRPGDRVAVSAPHDSEIIVAYLAALRLGLVWVGINRNLAPAEKLFMLGDCGAKLVLATPEIAATLTELPAATTYVRLGSPDEEWSHLVSARDGEAPDWPPVDPFGLAAIAYTSGTTGRPKGACHSQHGMMTFPAAGFHALADSFWQPSLRRSATIAITILNGMIFGPLAALAGRATYVCVERPDALCVAETIERHRVECIATVPTTIYDFLHKPELQSIELASLKAVAVGGAPVSDQLKAEFEARFGFGVVEDYGMAESPCAVARTVEKEPVTGSMGRAYPHLEVNALDGDNILPKGIVGEVCVRPLASGPWANVYTGMFGYWNRPEETATAIRNGWLHTGDMGQVDEAGNLKIVGRVKDVILRGGANVYPAEIEDILRSDPRIEDAVVIAAPDARLGEIPAAYLTLSDPEADHSTLHEDLRKLCLANLAKYKMPQRWYIVPEMPRNAMLKVDKAALRQLSTARSLD
jgi:acyl-CoA synthetase (AMP-forming)/AMP-acid ligase II